MSEQLHHSEHAFTPPAGFSAEQLLTGRVQLGEHLAAIAQSQNPAEVSNYLNGLLAPSAEAPGAQPTAEQAAVFSLLAQGETQRVVETGALRGKDFVEEATERTIVAERRLREGKTGLKTAMNRWSEDYDDMVRRPIRQRGQASPYAQEFGHSVGRAARLADDITETMSGWLRREYRTGNDLLEEYGKSAKKLYAIDHAVEAFKKSDAAGMRGAEHLITQATVRNIAEKIVAETQAGTSGGELVGKLTAELVPDQAAADQVVACRHFVRARLAIVTPAASWLERDGRFGDLLRRFPNVFGKSLDNLRSSRDSAWEVVEMDRTVQGVAEQGPLFLRGIQTTEQQLREQLDAFKQGEATSSPQKAES